MENQFLDYKSFKDTNEDLIMHLVKNNSMIIARFKYVIAVVDYLYDQAVFEHKQLDNNENEMFEVGYQYIFDRFMTINMIKENVFHNNLFEMEQFAKSINLLFYAEDFLDEVDSYEGDAKKEHKELADFENHVMEMIENKKQVPDELFALIDDISLRIFNSLGIEYYGIPDIYYDIAIDLDLVKEDDPDFLDIDDILQNSQL